MSGARRLGTAVVVGIAAGFAALILLGAALGVLNTAGVFIALGASLMGTAIAIHPLLIAQREPGCRGRPDTN